MRTVDARRRPLWPFLLSWLSSSWESGGVIGVVGELVAVESEEVEAPAPLKSGSVTERERMPRGSSGMGLSGWEVEETGMSWKVLLRGRPETIEVVTGTTMPELTA